ncbi:F-box protein FBW2 [Platanthera guangdongensis]|uniref:F-box protein FBW2 n=1 Tax=Platanthera guangdongensis TaxID=2320717 RepID=A0ABR2ML15_9ASPA
MGSKSSWSSMETDCLVEIFARLGLEDIILVVPFVCKAWLLAARNPLCWRKLDFRAVDILPWSNFSKSFALCCSLPFFSFTYLLKFTISRSWKSVTEIRFPLKFTSPEDLIIASNECKYLKSVALPILSQCEEVQIPQLVCKWKDLGRLELESKPSNFKELVKNISLNCSKFSCFRISRSSFGKEDVLAIIRFLPKLKKFELISSYLPKEDLMIMIRGCKELESLNAIDCIGFNGDDEEITSKVSHMKDFKLEGCKLYYEYDYEGGDSRNQFCYDYII